MITDTDSRNNKRIFLQTENYMWEPLWEKIKRFIPTSVPLFDNQIWEPYGLNERFRFYRYHRGESFSVHYDGCFHRSSGDMSLLTFIIYLNDDVQGGETTFYVDEKKLRVIPKQGSALLFWHGYHPSSPLHEGSECLGGSKYVLRSDIMYKRS
eukprot:TRINITY_DN4068_c0_g1_i4.p1 TRINITY_DN4068_c0_g1~~TRINITY_DN4068_c0_g1_i4.p1  ORF type:complete len:153 (+),score=14.68 TRINITY_DN4068_c0_g1_i4:293-751(+)